jgi:hypothetical protein
VTFADGISIQQAVDYASETKELSLRPSAADAIAVLLLLCCGPYAHQLRSEPPHPTPLPCGEREQAVLVART